MVMEAITESRLRDAARRAVARGDAVAAILFGSRARGTARPESDWDVCLITNGAGMREEERDRILEKNDTLWKDENIERVWIPASEFSNGVHANSLNEAIKREGVVLSGDATVAKNAKKLPFKTQELRNDMSRSAQQLAEAINAARWHQEESDGQEALHTTVTMSLRTIGAVEALTRAMCKLTNTDHNGNHAIGRNALRMREKAAQPGAPLDRAITEAMSAQLEQMNGNTTPLRKAEYTGEGESHDEATRRLARALDTDRLIRLGLGLVQGKGEWASLKNHPRRNELKEELERDTAGRASRNAREWAGQGVTLADKALDQAMKEWVGACQEIKIALLTRKHNRSIGG